MSTPWNNDSIRALERASIRSFMESNRQYLKGRVLDFGCGTHETCQRPQPYRDLVEGEYVGMDKANQYPAPPFDAVMCTQVIQYLKTPRIELMVLRSLLKQGGYLVMTYPTNWDEVESTDLWRFTRAGMETLLESKEFKIVKHERRAEIDLNGFKFALGYGIVAKRA